jgi:hypothetical protein
VLGRGALAAVLLLSLGACRPAVTFGAEASALPPEVAGASSPAGLSPPGSAASAPSVPGSAGRSSRLHVVRAPRRVFDDAHLQPGGCHVRQDADGRPLPDPACTPGAIDPAVNESDIKATICRPGYTRTVRPPASDTDRWKRTAEAAYGIASGEYDHLVPLELGGANATSNLWVEPGAIPNPKDQVENRLKREVCAGTITLAAAQQAIASNWTTAP